MSVRHNSAMEQVEPAEPLESRQVVDQLDQVLGNLASQDDSIRENGLQQLETLTIPRESPHALPIAMRILDLLEHGAVLLDNVVDPLRAVCESLGNPELVGCIKRVQTLPYDTLPYHRLPLMIGCLIPTVSAAKYTISHIHLLGPLQDQTTAAVISFISENFQMYFTPRQIDDLLAYLLTPEALNMPPGVVTSDYGIDQYDYEASPVSRVFQVVRKLMPLLSSENWKTIEKCFFQLNYMPVELIPVLYDEQLPQGVDVDALIVACYEVASESCNSGTSLAALEVLMRRQSEMDDRLLAKIAGLILSNLGADDVGTGEYSCEVYDEYLEYLYVLEGSAMLVTEVLRLQTASRWNEPLLKALFGAIRVETGFQGYRALMRIPDWPAELLRQFTPDVLNAIFNSQFIEGINEGARDFWARVCREYPGPRVELLVAFSNLVEVEGVQDRASRPGTWGPVFLDVLETMIGSSAYQEASPRICSLFWQRLSPIMDRFLSSDQPEVRSKASAIISRHLSHD